MFIEVAHDLYFIQFISEVSVPSKKGIRFTREKGFTLNSGCPSLCIINTIVMYYTIYILNSSGPKKKKNNKYESYDGFTCGNDGQREWSILLQH